MVEHGQILRSDVFTSTVAGTPYNVGEWLGELVMYGAFALDGWAGLAILRALVAAGSAFFLARASRREGAPLVASLLVVIWALVLARTRWTDRPQYFGLLLFTMLFDVLLVARSGRPRALFLVPPILALWANLHGSYPLGLGLVGAFAAEALLLRRAARPFVLAAGAALLATQLTPFGIDLGAAASHGFAPPRFISEEAPPDVREPAGFIFSIFVIAVIAATAVRRPGLLDVLLLGPLLWLALSAQRHMAFFAFAATPYLAAAAADAWRRLPLLQGPLRPIPPRAVNGLVALLGVLAIASVAVAPRAPDERGFPVGALATLRAGQGVLLNEYDWGGFIEWYVPGRPTFVDGRLFPFLPTVLADYAALIDTSPGWKDVLERRGIRDVLIRPERSLAGALVEAGWRVQASGPTFLYLVRP